ncbi:tRNA pseudouridine synthase [Trichinella pseudospiralis]
MGAVVAGSVQIVRRQFGMELSCIALLGVLVRFRCGRIAVNAEVEKMSLTPTHSDMLAFLWTSSVDTNLAEFLKQRRLGKHTLNCENLDGEKKKIVKESLVEDFAAEILACNKARGRSHSPRSGALHRKQVFLDQDGILRVPTAPLHVHPLQYREFPFVEWACFGPFVISRKQEMWGLIFMCLQQQELFIWKTAYRQTSSRFLLASERFIQRRGKPQSI